jgi:hypothetical protein
MENENLKLESYDQLLAEFDKFLLLKDRNIMKALIATIIANQMNGDPNWLFVVGQSSGGKSELIQALNDITSNGKALIVPISDLTINAFASGQKKVGKETSLLHRIPPGGILSFKDFTSMISKNHEAKQEIYKQLREIYDGSYVKHTGTGDNVTWKGKVGAIAGATEVVYEHQEEFSAMGDRFLMYSLIQPDRKEVTEFVMSDARINANRDEERKYMRHCVKIFVERIMQTMDTENITLKKEVKQDIQTVADFCTRVRSGVIVDERKSHIIRFVPSIEMPMRMLHQLINLAKAFVVIRKAEPTILGGHNPEGFLTVEETNIIYKIAFDSMPIKRRMALKLLAKYTQGVTTKGLAVAINYQTDVVKAWLAQLNALGVITRDAQSHGNQGDKWFLRDEFREIMVKFDNIKVTTEALSASEEENEKDIDQSWEEEANLENTKFKESEMDSLNNTIDLESYD